jgi:hypothetical protein
VDLSLSIKPDDVQKAVVDRASLEEADGKGGLGAGVDKDPQRANVKRSSPFNPHQMQIEQVGWGGEAILV